MARSELDHARDELAAAADELRAVDKQRDQAHNRVATAIVRARRAGMTPTEAERLSPFTAAWTRRIAREGGIPPAREPKK